MRLVSRGSIRSGVSGPIDAAVDVVGVNAGVFLERPRILVQPEDRGFQFVPENLEIDLTVPRESGVIDLAGQSGQGPADPLDPLRPRRGGKVFQQGIEAVVAEARGVGGLLPEVVIQVAAEERRQVWRPPPVSRRPEADVQVPRP